MDDWYSDPLELRTDSQLGVPGLLEMARSGTVAVVNTLGSGVLENPALMAFLPRIGRHLLGNEPQLESVPTWWCGEPQSLSYVTEHLNELVVRPIHHGPGRSTRLGWELSVAELDELRAKIRHEPARWAAQTEVSLRSEPVLTDDGLESRRSVTRAFAVARGDSFMVMPGGLTRVQPSGEAHRMSGQAGSVAKDTWVLASEPETLGAFWLQSGPAIEGIDPMASIPSRAAENLWWLGRYAERAEAITRLLRTVVDRTNEFGSGTNPAGSTALDELMGALHWISGGQATLADPVRSLLDNAYAVRDQLSRDTWLVIGPLERIMQELRVPIDEPQLQSQAALQQVIQSLLALGGLGVESMVRDLGWRFMDAGRRLERSIQLLSLLQSTVVRTRDTATDSIVLESVLSAAESIITYRFRYRSQAQLETLLELLLLDTGNPRSLAYQLDRLIGDLEALPLDSGRARLRPEQRLALEASTMLRLAEPEQLARVDEHGNRPALQKLLDDLVGCLLAAGHAVDSTHFVHTAPTFSRLGTSGTWPAIVKGS